MSRPSCDTGTGDEGCPVAIFCKIKALMPQPRPKTYPSIASIPQTSTARLAQATEDAAHDGDNPTPNTHLYLAYGSNLAAETFLGMRGIRPLSQTNVNVPTLELKFNLPGVPYREPCFANVDYRKIPDHPKLPDPSNPPRIPPIDPPTIQPPRHAQTLWNEGLVGVVYEVTEEDYRTIIRTEGGGAGYKEIVVPCVPIPPKISVPEKPPFPELPKPFLARTLFAPQIPAPDLPDDPRKKKWWYRFLVGPQREPGYAQPSARYLKLITDGAEEHELPDGYQRWLKSLQPYTITTWRQQMGALLFFLTSGLPFLLLLFISRFVADKDGKLPHWMVIAMTVMINLIWMEYDAILEQIFGDGERTQDDENKKRNHEWTRMFGNRCRTADEEKMLLREFD